VTRRQRSLMLEAKRMREHQKRARCRCRSNKLAGACCLHGHRWHKPAARLNLRAYPMGQALDRCYMRELGNCEPPISAEHLISEGVIEVLRAGGEFTVSGLPWLEAGLEILQAVAKSFPVRLSETWIFSGCLKIRMADQSRPVSTSSWNRALDLSTLSGSRYNLTTEAISTRSSACGRAFWDSSLS
jgi:hypothetical protein